MGKNNLKNRARLWFLMPLIALAAGGCILPDNTPFPTPTPRPVITVIPSPTPSPRPSAVPSATTIPTGTQAPSPTATEPVQVQCSIEWRWIDNELIVSEVNLRWADGLAVGDRVVAINGRLPLEVILEAEKEIGSGLEGDALRRAALRYILTSNNNRVLVLAVRHNGEPRYFFNLLPNCR